MITWQMVLTDVWFGVRVVFWIGIGLVVVGALESMVKKWANKHD